ncbi:anti-sigma factor antagonist [Pseudonocardia hispaniensis]|uniref:Anti-sigma factor antagonist n=1 Tax=Pseudonocardia hispaniensis TaxID=904933 RepID=A0ABW1J699_9PSEU
MADTHAPFPGDPSPIRRASEVDGQITVAVTAPAPGTAVITVGGELDMLTSPQLRAVMLDQLGPGGALELIVLGLNDVTFLGTSGLAVLIEIREAAFEAGVGLRLVCTGHRVLRPLSIAGLLPMFDIRGSVEEALEPP